MWISARDDAGVVGDEWGLFRAGTKLALTFFLAASVAEHKGEPFDVPAQPSDDVVEHARAEVGFVEGGVPPEQLGVVAEGLAAGAKRCPPAPLQRGFKAGQVLVSQSQQEQRGAVVRLAFQSLSALGDSQVVRLAEALLDEGVDLRFILHRLGEKVGSREAVDTEFLLRDELLKPVRFGEVGVSGRVVGRFIDHRLIDFGGAAMLQVVDRADAPLNTFHLLSGEQGFAGDGWGAKQE